MEPSSSPVADILYLKKGHGATGPSLVSIINTSLRSGCALTQFKQAFVQMLLKKSNLDPSLPNKYRTISKLPVVSKHSENVVGKQLTEVRTSHL